MPPPPTVQVAVVLAFARGRVPLHAPTLWEQEGREGVNCRMSHTSFVLGGGVVLELPRQPW
eukprot:14248175-Alexandrium_andersonii.AAC.1